LARDIHDNLAQGFGAILMQLQAAQREDAPLPPSIARSIGVAIDLARTHLSRRGDRSARCVPTSATARTSRTRIKRMPRCAQKASDVPIDVSSTSCQRFGDGVEREVIGIARKRSPTPYARARPAHHRSRIASTSLGLRLSIADDGRGIPRERHPTASA
jgi:hypothetical protein